MRDKWIEYRIWVQEHGEKSALAALVFGIIFVLLFKLLMWILTLVFIAGCVIYLVALPESTADSQSRGSSDPSD